MKKQCDKRPAEGAFTIGGVYDFKMRSEGTGGYTVKDDKGREVIFPNSICFLSVSKGGRVSKPAKTIPRGTSYIPVQPKKNKDDEL